MAAAPKKKTSATIALATAMAFLAGVTFASLFSFNHWWLRMWDFPRLQLAIALALVLCGSIPLFKSRWRLRILWLAGFISLTIQVAEVAPYTPLYPEEVERAVQEPTEKVSILASNVLMSNRNTKGVLELINQQDPDIVLLTEPDKGWLEAVSSIEPKYPFKVLEPLDNTYGIALYSKFELLEPQIKYLIEDDIPSIHTKVLLPSGKVMMLYCVHPRPPAPQESDSTAQRDGELMVIAGLASKDSAPVIVAGDLNDVAWSDTTRLFRKVSGLLDPRVGRGFYNTFHADFPFLRFPLDHFFHSSQFRLVSLERLGNVGSDHLPIMMTLAPGAGSEGWGSVEPEADHEDLEEAQEAVVEGVQEEALDTKSEE